MSRRICRGIWLFLLAVALLGLTLLSNGRPMQAATPIKIAIIQDLSGAHGDAGIAERYGYQLALDEANDAGGVQGRKIEYTVGDDNAKVDRGISLAKRAVERDKVSVIMGSNMSTVSLGIIKVAVESRTPQVSGSYATPLYQGATPQENGYWHFASFGNNEDLGRYTLALAQREGLKKVGLTYINVAWGKDMRAACEKYASQYGIQIIGTVTIESEATEVIAPLSKLKALNPDGILIFNLPGDAAAVYRALAALNWSLPTFPTGPLVPSIVQIVDPNLMNGAIFGMCADIEAPEVNQLVDRGEKYYKIKITMKDYNVRAYNAGLAVIKALAACKDPNNPSEVRDQMEKVKPFPMCAPVPGNLGPMQWNKVPHLMFTEYCPFVIRGGKITRKK